MIISGDVIITFYVIYNNLQRHEQLIEDYNNLLGHIDDQLSLT